MASSVESDATLLYSKGNEAFVEEDYVQAAKCYTEAINVDDSNANYFVCRAHALQKLEKYKEAKTDAERAIQLSPSNAKAYLRKGTACFNLGDYQQAKSAFLEGQKIEDAGFKQWITWCDEKLAKEPKTAIPEPELSSEVREAEKPVTAQTPAPERVKHDWYQTETHVCITVLVKNLDPKNVKVDFSSRNVSMTATLPSGSDFVFDKHLAHVIVPEQSTYSVLKTKVEIKLKKAEGIRWNTLEDTGEAPGKVCSSMAPVPTTSGPTYPSSSRKKKDWDKIEVEITKEESSEKAEGEAALNQLFQKIYGEGSDEVRRAMNKSFVESGGTVLSTNWKDVAKDKVEVKPPDGMEYRKWEA